MSVYNLTHAPRDFLNQSKQQKFFIYKGNVLATSLLIVHACEYLLDIIIILSKFEYASEEKMYGYFCCGCIWNMFCYDSNHINELYVCYAT